MAFKGGKSVKVSGRMIIRIHRDIAGSK